MPLVVEQKIVNGVTLNEYNPATVGNIPEVVRLVSDGGGAEALFKSEGVTWSQKNLKVAVDLPTMLADAVIANITVSQALIDRYNEDNP